MDTWIVCLPVTISWGALIVIQISQWFKICRHHRNVHSLTKSFERCQVSLKGHNTKHCTQFKMAKFVDKMTMALQLIISLSYLQFFFKLHFAYFDQIQYSYLHWIGIFPLIFCYGYEILSELCKVARNKIKISDPAATSKHKRFLVKFNLGLLPNYLCFTAFFSIFSHLFAQKMDGATQISLFIILIPLWLLVIYVVSFVVLAGLASKNKKINICEKILLALVPPLGFITSGVLAICVLEGYFTCQLWILFMPEVGSALFLYLYVRCLVKPSGTKVQSETTK